MKRPQHAFTLIELLVVIAIMVVLIAILIPSLSGAKKHAAATKCGAQMHGVAQAVAAYLAEWSDAYAGAVLLGFDMARTCQRDTRQKLLPIVDTLKDGNASSLTLFVRTYDEEDERHQRRLITDHFAWLARVLRCEPLG